MKRILLTNDDGVRSEGIQAVAAELKTLGELVVVAPLAEASAIGHALTLRRPLRLETISKGVYAVDGTPTDCVNIAITSVLRGMPDLVISGINRGWNLGDDVTYSGTVSGALEAALLGRPAIAVSLQNKGENLDFSEAARAARILAQSVLEKGLPSRTFLNVNVPIGPTRGFRVTVKAKRNHVTKVDERVDPRGQRYFWIEEGQNEWEPHDRSDYQAVRDGYISITPLQPDLTAYNVIPTIEELLEVDAISGSRSRSI
jgi:5'/3'-nucleotidase